MIDHLLMFASEGAARAALPAYTLGDGWRPDCVIAGQRVIVAPALWDETDAEAPVLLSPEVAVPGYFLTVSLPALSEDLVGLAGAACRVAADRETGARLYVAPDLDVGLLASASVTPVPAGSAYRFG